jgi:hypothetical protein
MMFSKTATPGYTPMPPGEQRQMKYFYFFKYQDNTTKKKTGNSSQSSPYEKTIALLSHEDRIIQKNLKILLSMTENLEQYEFSVRNKNNALDILNVIEQTIEKVKAQKKYSQNNYDWSGTLISLSIKNRFMKNKANPHAEF